MNNKTQITDVESKTDDSNQNLPKKNVPPMYVYALGGLGEVGKNMYVVEQGNELWIMDAGIKFSSELSIEGVIPSFEWLEKQNKKIRGLIITHGHEDHIGAVPHLIHSVKIPKIYAGKIAVSLIRNKIQEKNLPQQSIETISNISKIKTLNFQISFFNVNHSIPDCYGVVFKSKHGTVINTADFKFDFSPVGSRADLYKMASYGKSGVTLLLSDSTNANIDKFSLSEAVVSKNLNNIVERTKGRIIIATFASNVFRVREIINIANRNNRKIAVFGFSMEKVIKISRKIKYINVSEKLFVDTKEIKNIDDNKLLIICTGTQGESMAALSKMANDKHKDIKIKKEDTIVFASSAIPGNFEPVEIITNKLIQRGCKIINNKNTPGIHASGHGGKQEQLLMFNLLRPEYFFPVHGETAMQIKHGKTAVEAGVSEKNVFILSNGRRLKVENGVVSESGSVVADNVYVDDTNLKGQSLKVIVDRNVMSTFGIAIVTISINSIKNVILYNPEIDLKGVMNIKENQEFVKWMSLTLRKEIEYYYKSEAKITFNGLKEIIRVSIEKKIFDEKRIKPIVVPVILNIKNNYNQAVKKIEKLENKEK